MTVHKYDVEWDITREEKRGERDEEIKLLENGIDIFLKGIKTKTQIHPWK